MKRNFRPNTHKWIILGFFLGLIAMFQNMSWVDIRDLAPEKPQGYLQEPMSAYVPREMSARSLDEVGQGLLSHNFDPWFHQFETKYLRTETPFFGISFLQPEDLQNGEMASVASAGESKHSDMGKWRVAIVSPQKMRVTLQKRWSGHEFEMTWEADTSEEGIRWALTQPLSDQMKLGFVHQTGLRQSQIQMNYDF